MVKVKFIKTAEITEEFYPVPASSLIPDWYKEIQSYITENSVKKPDIDNATTATIKKCVPVFDAMTAGYLILLPADLYIHQQDGEPYYQWSSLNLVSFHVTSQAPNHPHRGGLNVYPKFMNYWGIKTPKGYSCLFTQPMHREAPFTILEGVVDTDSYYAPVNFPFVLKDKSFEGMIPAGTPIAQIIPFKREQYKMEFGIEDVAKINNTMSTRFFDRYRNLYWQRKSYK
jgi:hypothetical protein